MNSVRQWNVRRSARALPQSQGAMAAELGVDLEESSVPAVGRTATFYGRARRAYSRRPGSRRRGACSTRPMRAFLIDRMADRIALLQVNLWRLYKRLFHVCPRLRDDILKVRHPLILCVSSRWLILAALLAIVGVRPPDLYQASASSCTRHAGGSAAARNRPDQWQGQQLGLFAEQTAYGPRVTVRPREKASAR